MTYTSNKPKRAYRRLRYRLRDLRCRLGFHVAEPIHEDAYGTHGGDCRHCGLGPL